MFKVQLAVQLTSCMCCTYNIVHHANYSMTLWCFGMFERGLSGAFSLTRPIAGEGGHVV